MKIEEIFKDEFSYFEKILFKFTPEDLKKVFPFLLLVIFSSKGKIKININHEEKITNLFIHFLSTQNSGKSYLVNTALALLPEELAIPIGTGESLKSSALRGKRSGYIVFDEVQKSFVKYLLLQGESLTNQLIKIWNSAKIENQAVKIDETKISREKEEEKKELSRSSYDMSASCFFIGIEKTYIKKIPVDMFSDGFFARNIFVPVPAIQDDDLFINISTEELQATKEMKELLVNKYDEFSALTGVTYDEVISITDTKTISIMNSLGKNFILKNKNEHDAITANIDRAVKDNAVRCAVLLYCFSRNQYSIAEWYEYTLINIIQPSVDYFKNLFEDTEEIEIHKIIEYTTVKEKIQLSRFKQYCERALGIKLNKQEYIEIKQRLLGLNRYGNMDQYAVSYLEVIEENGEKIIQKRKLTEKQRKDFGKTESGRYFFPQSINPVRKKEILESSKNDEEMLRKMGEELFGI